MTIESRLAEVRARVDAATEGPWAPWYDQDGAPHMDGLLMVGNGDGVIPEGAIWIEDVDINPVAHTYTPEDREFIAASRTDLPALLAAVQAVREKLPSLLEAAWDDGNALGLDGWIGPERGEEPDEHAIRRRARLRDRLVDEAYEAIAAALEVEGNE